MLIEMEFYIKELEQENKQLKEQINEYQKAVDETTSEKIDLQQENKQLKKNIKNVVEFCDRYMGVNLELFDIYELLNKIREILEFN